MTQPERFGGHAMGWDVLCGVSQRLTRADGAQGWVQAIMADHAQMLGTFPLLAQEDVWGKNPEAVMSASFDPKGIATPVESGYSFSGRFGFASGIDHADWLICGGFIVDRDKGDGPHFCLLRRSEATIIDDWHTIGLEKLFGRGCVRARLRSPAGGRRLHRQRAGRRGQSGRGVPSAAWFLDPGAVRVDDGRHGTGPARSVARLYRDAYAALHQGCRQPDKPCDRKGMRH